MLVKNSYSIREQMKALEFLWDGERRAWYKGVSDVKVLLKIEDQNDITIDMLLEVAKAKMDSAGNAKAGGVPPHQGGIDSYLRSPSPARVDQNPGEQLLSSMGNSHQGWAPTVSAH